ncbi:B3 domain-containing transcription factor VRN1 [Camellia lanceoleosa]|uniref:B3 domain-containing transcription factor VRN1 n=1 Tax=Camellia lanceoleosa TaxID=1840588 RepID=A0ACC0I8F3_9ERIC|nr:B3 domain-containing transcription factor VRN1 [Camellia lanceoleosa]
MKYYSISYGHFLVFQYNGNSIFHVLIFDKSASEIEYPFGQTNQNWDFQIPETEDVELDDSVEILDDFLTCQGTFEKDGSVEILNDPPTCKRRKMMRTNLTCKTKNDSNLHSRGIQSKEGKLANLNEDVTREIRKECSEGMHTAQGRLPSQVPDRRKSVNVDHRFRALQRAKGFESKNPFFMVYMQPSYLRPKQSLLQRDTEELTKYLNRLEKPKDIHLHSEKPINMVNSSRRSAVGSSWSRSPAVKATHFFKIVKSSVDQLQKLRIPRKFMTKHGKNLANLVFLNVPSGAVWKVELMNSNEEVWLSNGWKDFTQYYSIRFGHLLVFRYDGNSNFHVIIFDMSASEIEYPSHPTQKLQLLETEEDIEIDDSVEILEDFPTQQTKVEEVSERDEIERDSSIEILDVFPKCQTSRAADMEKDGSVEKLSVFGFLAEEHSGGTSIDGKARALQRAKAFKSENPFFMVSMHPSYVCFKFNLNVPLAFAMKHFSVKQRDVILRLSDGRAWTVNCYCHLNGKCKFGWASFVRDNNLKLGDVCIFELIKATEVCLNVTIFRAVY